MTKLKAIVGPQNASSPQGHNAHDPPRLLQFCSQFPCMRWDTSTPPVDYLPDTSSQCTLSHGTSDKYYTTLPDNIIASTSIKLWHGWRYRDHASVHHVSLMLFLEAKLCKAPSGRAKLDLHAANMHAFLGRPSDQLTRQ